MARLRDRRPRRRRSHPPPRPGCCAVACEPAPTDGEFEDDEPGYKAAQTKIAKVWESVGFTEFSNGIYLLDTALQHPIDCRTSWQRHFGRR